MKDIKPDANIDSTVEVADNVCIESKTVIKKDCKIGNNVIIKEECILAEGTVVEDDVYIGPQVITSNERIISSHGRPKKGELSPPVIKRGARIYAGTIIGPGVTIGENAMTGLGSLVIRDIPANELWAGHPAKKLKDIPKDELL